MVIVCGSVDGLRCPAIMHPNCLHVSVLLIMVLSGVWCKEKTVPEDISDYQDSTVPLDIKNVSGVDPPLVVLYDETPGTDPTASPGVARASAAESSTTRSEKAEVEVSTVAAPGHKGETQVKQAQVTNSTVKRKHTIIDPVSVKLLRGETNGISVTDVSLSKSTLYFNFTQARTYSVDYHYAKRFIFFTAANRIFRDEVVGRLTRTGPPKVVVAAGVDGPVRLAVDWVHDRVYWLSDNHQIVEVADLDGGNRTLLFDTFQDIRFPNNIAIDPYAGYLFLVSNYSVFRADLDGANLTRLHLEQEDTRGVKCLALDTRNKRVYYSGKEGDPETGTPYIASCNYEGGSYQDHPLAYKWNDIFSLDVFRDTLYFAHYSRRVPDTIYSVDLSKPTLMPVRLQATDATNGGIWSVRVYHPRVQQDPKKCGGRNENQIRGA